MEGLEKVCRDVGKLRRILKADSKSRHGSKTRVSGSHRAATVSSFENGDIACRLVTHAARCVATVLTKEASAKWQN